MLKKRRIKRCEQAMAEAQTYAEWAEIAAEHDQLSGAEDWRDTPASNEFDFRLIQSRVQLLRRLRRKGDLEGLMYYLREELHGNLGNMANPVLYRRALLGTKRIIHDFLAEVDGALTDLCEAEEGRLPRNAKLRFFDRASGSFGRSALMLSGGATLGLFHLGVIRELWEQGLLPWVVSGSSAGSVIAGVLGTHTDEELEAVFNPNHMDMVWSRLTGFRELVRGEGMLDIRALRTSIDRNIPRMTFEEAFAHSGRRINISVSPADPNQFPRLLNYLTAPHVWVGRAALASSAIPGLFPPVVLYAKDRDGNSVKYMPTSRWIDGSVHNDVPKRHIGRMHNVNHFIVSQTNPHVVPFLNDEPDGRGILPFARQLLIRGPLVQIETVLELAQRHLNVPGLDRLIKSAHAISSQPYRGDVTIYPSRQISDWLSTLSNPTPELLNKLVLDGRRAVWPRLAHIRNTTLISRRFDACRSQIGRRSDVPRTLARVPNKAAP